MIIDNVKTFILMTFIGAQALGQGQFCRVIFEPFSPITLPKILGTLPPNHQALKEFADFFQGKTEREIQFLVSGKSSVKYSDKENSSAKVSHEQIENTHLHMRFLGSLVAGNLTIQVRFRDFKNFIFDISNSNTINNLTQTSAIDGNTRTSILPLSLSVQGDHRGLVIERDFINHPDDLATTSIHLKKSPDGRIESIVVRVVFKYEDGSISTRTYDFNRVRTNIVD